MTNVLVSFSLVVFLKFKISKCCELTLEKGDRVKVNCPFTENVTDIIWQMADGQNFINLSICNCVSSTCFNQMPSLYQGYFVSSSGEKKSSLDIVAARRNETQFRCVTDYGESSDTCLLHVYARPKKPTCSQRVTNTYVDIECVTQNVYPSVTGILHRRQAELFEHDVDLESSTCSLGTDGSGLEGDYSATCTWRIPMTNMHVSNTFYVQMSAFFSDSIKVNTTPSISDDINTKLSVPQVVVYARNCPAGVTDSVIPIGTVASCKCELLNAGFPKGFAQWRREDRRIIGEQNSLDGSSTLHVSFNLSDPSPTFQCWPKTPLIGAKVVLPQFTPKFALIENEGTTSKSDNLRIIVGLSVGIGLLTFFVTVTCIMLIWKRRAGIASRPPIYSAEWVNKHGNQAVVNPPFDSDYVIPLPHDPWYPSISTAYAMNNSASEGFPFEFNTHSAPPKPHSTVIPFQYDPSDPSISNDYAEINSVDECFPCYANNDATPPPLAPRPHTSGTLSNQSLSCLLESIMKDANSSFIILRPGNHIII